MDKNNRYEIYTLCRSGNHAIIFWLIDNICKIDKKYDGMCYWNDDAKLYYYNNCNHINYNNFMSDYNYLLLSYEDADIIENKNTNIVESKNITGTDTIEGVTNKVIVIVRDYLNFMASRYKKYGCKLGLNDSYLQDYKQIKNLWIKLCNDIIAGKAVGIIYNKWLISKEYRDEVSLVLNIPNINDNTSFVSDIGEGSSFCGVKLENDKNNYLNRFDPSLFKGDGQGLDLYEMIKYDFDNDLDIININKILFE